MKPQRAALSNRLTARARNQPAATTHRAQEAAPQQPGSSSSSSSTLPRLDYARHARVETHAAHAPFKRTPAPLPAAQQRWGGGGLLLLTCDRLRPTAAGTPLLGTNSRPAMGAGREGGHTHTKPSRSTQRQRSAPVCPSSRVNHQSPLVHHAHLLGQRPLVLANAALPRRDALLLTHLARQA
jgi:hypothetical protein